MSKVLVIDDSQKVRQNIVEILKFEDYEVAEAGDGEQGVHMTEEFLPDLIICDIAMPGLDGYEVLSRLRANPVTLMIPFIFLSGKSATDEIRRGMILGADDYLTKPFMAEDLLLAVDARISRWKAVSVDLYNESSKRLVGSPEGEEPPTSQDSSQTSAIEPGAVFYGIVGESAAMQEVFRLIQHVSDVDVPVLILGETGCGKELVARALHDSGLRHDGPFVSINCAALPDELVESELFGHEKGAFTGAHQRHIGKAEIAEGGTLFLDEIGEMDPSLQAKMLRFLQERTFERVGSNTPIVSDVRIVAATNRDIDTAVSEGRIRMDLLYRLNTITLTLPPLRDRLDDIPLLVTSFVDDANQRFGYTVESVDPNVFGSLMTYQWPGNVRELKNVVDRAVVLTKSGILGQDQFRMTTPNLPSPNLVARAASVDTNSSQSLTDLKTKLVDQFERIYIDNLLREVKGNVSEAARTAGIDRRNLIAKMNRFDLRRDDYLG
jgi:two-component system, NtrC family, response regulator AtoC